MTIYLISIIAGLIILYLVIKYAVKSAIKEERNKPIPDANHSAKSRLQQQYDRGQITFEKYKEEWNKL